MKLTEEFKEIYQSIIEPLCEESFKEDLRIKKTFGFVYEGIEFDFEVSIIFGKLELECVFINGEMVDYEIGYPIIEFLT